MLENGMRPNRLIIAVILFLVGLLWIGQGTGLIAGSAMSDVGVFALIGLVLVVLAVAIVVRERGQPAKS
ncbi:MAG: hypothetical protein ACSLFN_08195 [Candidatus Limnocylindrales bacterium]